MQDEALSLVDKVAIPAASGVIGKTLDFGGKISAEPDVVYELCVDEDFAGGTSAQVTLQTSDDNSTFTTVYAYPAIALASGKAGLILTSPHLPVNGVGRYLRVYLAIVGTFTAGKFSVNAQTWSNDRP
ncbi:MAG: hypothetical protein LBL00_07830 [Endomicrobium sp.]|jgi:hypothetical protein|nr:hypothetical protein [Endomicrobium sp.]